MHFVNADRVIARPLAIIKTLAQRESSVVECSSDGQRVDLEVSEDPEAGLYADVLPRGKREIT